MPAAFDIDALLAEVDNDANVVQRAPYVHTGMCDGGATSVRLSSHDNNANAGPTSAGCASLDHNDLSDGINSSAVFSRCQGNQGIMERLDSLEARSKASMKLLEQIWLAVRAQKGSATYDLPDGVQLPCASLQELQVLEDQLNKDHASRQQFIVALKRHGAAEVDATVRSFACSLLTNKLAAKLNLQGTDMKVGFQANFPTVLKCMHGKFRFKVDLYVLQ
jgi:hypothetical protein